MFKINIWKSIEPIVSLFFLCKHFTLICFIYSGCSEFYYKFFLIKVVFEFCFQFWWGLNSLLFSFCLRHLATLLWSVDTMCISSVINMLINDFLQYHFQLSWTWWWMVGSKFGHRRFSNYKWSRGILWVFYFLNRIIRKWKINRYFLMFVYRILW